MLDGKLNASGQSLESVAEAPLVLLRDYWRAAAAGRPWLPNAELRPERFAQALEHIAIVERVASPRQGHRIRLCGSDIENKDFGIVRGAFLEDARPDWYRDHLVGEVSRAIDGGAPTYQRVEATIDRRTFTFARLMLPLASGAGVCDMVLVATVRPSNQIVTAMRARLALA
jgi:hypothetical protein